MKNETFPVISTNAVFNKWRELEQGEIGFTAWDYRLHAAVNAAIDAGLFYNEDVYKFVAARIPVAPTDLELGHGDKWGNVERGCFGYEIYHCRCYIERKREESKRTLAAAKIAVGQVFKNIRLNSHRLSTVTVTNVTPQGFVAFDGKKRGSPRGWKGTAPATCFLPAELPESLDVLPV